MTPISALNLRPSEFMMNGQRGRQELRTEVCLWRIAIARSSKSPITPILTVAL